eukprot:scaffold201_cov405-Prasinococcus_capsulatus_cf.AAC.5
MGTWQRGQRRIRAVGRTVRHRPSAEARAAPNSGRAVAPGPCANLHAGSPRGIGTRVAPRREAWFRRGARWHPVAEQRRPLPGLTGGLGLLRGHGEGGAQADLPR